MFRHVLKLVTIFMWLVFQVFPTRGQTPVNFKVAFIADQGLEPESQAVLSLIKSEGAQAVLHAGDFDYDKDPQAWEDQINAVLGQDFPYFACIGEDDEKRFFTLDGYQDRLEARMTRLGILWDGDLGVQSSFHYNGIFFVQTAPSVEDGEHANYIRDRLSVDNSFWRISTFHKNMKEMQVCSGGNSTGWDVYEESRRGGAFTTNGQCHVYARTFLMSSMSEQTVASISDTLVLSRDLPETAEDEGRSFHLISGLGGRSVHRQERDGDWWASIYSREQDATYGALFGAFNYNGNPKMAKFYFKTIEGTVVDSFYVQSEVKDGFHLTVNSDGLGEVDLNPAGGVYEEGEVVTLTARHAPGWPFERWSGDLTGTANPVTIAMNTDKTVTAVFTAPKHTLAVAVTGNGRVQQDPPGGLHSWGTVVTLSAMPRPGHTFIGWSGDAGSTENPLSLLIDSDKRVTALFKLNNPPQAVGDTWATNEDDTLRVAVPGVLANDSDADGDGLTASLLGAPSNGSLILQSDGSFVYIPLPNFHGGDTFTYSVTDGNGGAANGQVSVTVNSVNDPPMAAADSFGTLEDHPLNIAPPGLLANDSDVDGDNVRASVAIGPNNGLVTLREDGAFSYTPAAHFNGVDAFTYSVNDGAGGTAIDTVTIAVAAVNDTPLAADDAFSVSEDSTLTVAAPGVVGNDSDVDGDSLSVRLLEGPKNGTLNLQADGALTYSPNPSFSGSDSLSYVVSDQFGGADTATVRVAIRAVNDPPVALDDAYSTSEDTPLVVAAPGVLSNDSDVDGDHLALSVVKEPENGRLTLDAAGSFQFTPNSNFNGSVRFDYVVNDGFGATDTATVLITVVAVNDPPVAGDDAYEIDEDGTLQVDVPGVLGNDSDVEGTSLVSSITSGPQNGALTLDEAGSFRYAPHVDFNGTDTFEYAAKDGSGGSDLAKVTVMVLAIDDPLVAVADSYLVEEDTALRIEAPGVLANDVDVDDDGMTATIADEPQHGTLTLDTVGSFRYTPQKNFNGVDTFEYTLSDGSEDISTTTVTLTVQPANDPPVPVNDAFEIDEDDTLSVLAPGVLSNDHDVDSDSLFALVATNPENGNLTLDENGAFKYVPRPNFSGVDGFSYSLQDTKGGVANATVTVTVRAVNDPPLAVNDRFTLLEDDTLTVAAGGVLSNDSDVDGDDLTAKIVKPSEHGSVTFYSDGSFRYAPDLDFFGADAFEYVVTDSSGAEAMGVVRLEVSAVNDQPMAQPDSYALEEDKTLDVAPPGILSNDQDVDGDSLIAALLSKPLHGSLTLNSEGSFSYTPHGEFNGTDSFSYTVSDPNGGSASERVNLTIKSVNDAPLAQEDLYHVRPGLPLSVPAPGVLANDVDVDGDSLVVRLIDSPAGGKVRVAGDGSFMFTPSIDGIVTDVEEDVLRAFSYVAQDAHGATSEIAQVIIAITNEDPAEREGRNKFPRARDDVATTTQGRPVAIEVTANDTDVDGSINTGTVELVRPPLSGSAKVGDETGVITYAPQGDFVGDESFTYKVRDDNGAESNHATVTVTVTRRLESKIHTFTPTADAHVRLSRPTTNHGQGVGARVEVDEFTTYLKFQVAGLADSLQSVTLRLFVANGADDGGSIYSVSNNYPGTNTAWVENDLNASNAPTIAGQPIADLGVARRDSMVEADLTSAISGDGFYSFAIRKTSLDRVEYCTKEGPNPPELIIKTGTESADGTSDADGSDEDNESGPGFLPETVTLKANYPNPFNVETTIQYALPKTAKVELVIYNVKGQRVRTLAKGVQRPGHKTLLWRGKDDQGKDVSSGIYFLRLIVGGQNFSSKLVLQK